MSNLYLRHFGFDRAPFSIAPDPDFLFPTARHREAFAHLRYGVESDGGFVLLTGEVGTGKTTLCRALIASLPDDVDLALIFNPTLDVDELLASICDELGVECSDETSTKALVDDLFDHLLDAHADGRRTLLLIDEAQNLAPGVLEQIRLLTNLETDRQKLLRIILVGQPELRTMMKRHELRQLGQRITARCHLDGLSFSELGGYLRHRLDTAGFRGDLITLPARLWLHLQTGGVPRLINTVTDRALLGAFAAGSRTVDLAIMRRAAAEVLDTGPTRRTLIRAALAAGLLSVTVVAGAWWLARPDGIGPTTLAAPTPTVGDTHGPAGAAGVEAARPAAEGTEDRPAAPILPTPAAGPSPVPDPATTARERSEPPTLLSEVVGTDIETAARELLDRWSLPVMGALDAPCELARALALACLEQALSWRDLLALDRPALLQLSDDRWVALLHVDERTARIGSTPPNRVPLARLRERWNGRAVLYWLPPPSYREPLREGDAGAGIGWLRERLTIAIGRSPQPSTRGPRWFDAGLTGAVMRFQLDSGLDADGIVGPQTLMKLNAATGLGVPRLSEPFPEAGRAALSAASVPGPER